jgi:hypothetical protein
LVYSLKEEYEGILPVKIWIDPLSKNSLIFLIDFLSYMHIFDKSISLEIITFLKPAEFFNYESSFDKA